MISCLVHNARDGSESAAALVTVVHDLSQGATNKAAAHLEGFVSALSSRTGTRLPLELDLMPASHVRAP